MLIMKISVGEIICNEEREARDICISGFTLLHPAIRKRIIKKIIKLDKEIIKNGELK